MAVFPLHNFVSRALKALKQKKSEKKSTKCVDFEMISQFGTVSNNGGLSFAYLRIARTESIKAKKIEKNWRSALILKWSRNVGQLVTMAAFPLHNFVSRALKAWKRKRSKTIWPSALTFEMISQCGTVSNNGGLSFAQFCVARTESMKAKKIEKNLIDCVNFWNDFAVWDNNNGGLSFA